MQTRKAFLMVLTLAMVLSTGGGVSAQYLTPGKKKDASNSGSGQIYTAPSKQKGLLQKFFYSSSKRPDKAVVINGQEIAGLRPEMLGASYIPKTQDEMRMIALAHSSWQDQAMADMDRKAQTRIDAAAAQSERYLAQMEARRMQMTPVMVNPQQPITSSKPQTVIYNKPGLKMPRKVFTDYR